MKTPLLFSSVLLAACSFFPEQHLVVEEAASLQTDAGAITPRRAAMSAALGSAERPAQPTTPQNSPPSAAAPVAAGSGMNASAGTPATTMASAGASGAPAAGSGAPSPTDAPKGAQDPTCDFTGVWITKQIAVTVALEEPQFSNSWGYYEIEQSGTDFVVKNHIDCGGEGVGSGSATTSRATLEALVQHNKQIGRKGHFALTDGKCVLDIARFWNVRGADEERYLPNPTRDSTMSMAEVRMLKPLPTPRMPDGAVDFEGDGELGAATQISGIISGVRNSCQRDWDRWFTAPRYEITPSMEFSELTLRIEFETDESVMAPTSGLLAAGADPTDDWDHIMRFRFLGRTTDDPRAQAIIGADRVATCYAIQDAMPAEALQR